MRHASRWFVLLVPLLLVCGAWAAADAALPETAAKPRIVVIDPGHGTRHSRGGTPREAAFALQLGQRIQQLLKERNIGAILTHSVLDQDLGAKNADDDNRLRAGIANRSRAVLMVRLHFDYPDGRTCIYYPRLHPDKALAETSWSFAMGLWPFLRDAVPPGTPKGGVKGDEATPVGKAHGGLLEGSRAAKVPVVCVEVMPLTAKNTKWLQTAGAMDALASALAQGISACIARPD
jgi:N-acetylmuramoyl-L-alanine amidase